MNPLENPEEIIPVDFPSTEGYTETSESESFETSEQVILEEVMDLIFPTGHIVSVDVYAYVSRTSGKPVIRAVMERKIPDLVEGGLEEYEIRSSWTMPTAGQMDEYRQDCSSYQVESQSIMVNNLTIRDVIVANHLKELLLPPKYEPFPFKYTLPDRLSGDTVKRIKSMHSGIYDTLYTKFISDSCLIM